MHPNHRFRWTDAPAMLNFIAEVGFGQIFHAAGERPAVCQVPLLVTDGALRFHVSRGNICADHLDGATALATVLGPDGYVSPDWYGVPNEVPTWNYVAVEAIGPVRRLAQEELIALLDQLSEIHERKLAPKPAWTRAKLQDELFEGLLKSIIGFELRVVELRGTRKLNQNKSAQVVSSAAAALEAHGNQRLAQAMLAQILDRQKIGEA